MYSWFNNPKRHGSPTGTGGTYLAYSPTLPSFSTRALTKPIFPPPLFSWPVLLTPEPVLQTYRFRPSPGAVYLVDDTVTQPNGIAISPDEKTLYISDSGVSSGTWDANLTLIHGTRYNTTGKRGVYAYTVNEFKGGSYLTNKHPIWLAQDRLPDGLKVAPNGYVLTATGRGIDVLDPVGTLILRMQTNYTVQNFAWTGKDYETLWMMGRGGVSKVELNLKGAGLKIELDRLGCDKVGGRGNAARGRLYYFLQVIQGCNMQQSFVYEGINDQFAT